MKIEITLRNYRGFPESRPATFEIGPGFTALVGVNNSGKSSILRFLFEFRRLFASLVDPRQLLVSAVVTNPLLNGLGFFPKPFRAETPLTDPQGVFCNFTTGELSIHLRLLEFENPYPGSNPPPLTEVQLIVPRAETAPYRARIKLGGHWLDEMRSSINFERLRVADDFIYSDEGPAVTWRPIADAFELLSNTFYIGPFRNALNLTQSDPHSYFDISIGQNLIAQWQNMQSGLSNKLSERAHQMTADICDIFRFRDLQFISSPDHQTIQVMADGYSYKLNELGSGLAQFFLTFANIAGREPQPSYILIDEPELNLHPALQLDFLVSLTSYATQGIVFASHSVGLARTIAHPIYSVYRDEAGISTIQALEDPANWAYYARELSFSGHSELGFDTILLAEGKNDIPTLQQFLRLYSKDHRVMLWPMHGKELINPGARPQLQEMKRISDRVFALIDSERSAANEALQPRIQGFVEACRDAHVECKVLDYRALENYLSERAVKHVMGDKRRALQPYEKLVDISPSWPKTDDWRIARTMTKSELEGTDLGEFLDRL